MPPSAPFRGSEIEIISFIIAYVNFLGSLGIAVLLLVKTIEVAVAINRFSSFHEVEITVLVILCVLLIIVVIDLLFAGALIIGLHKFRPGYLKGYMIYSAFFVIFFIADFIVTAVLWGRVTVTFGLFHWFPIAIIICFILVIRLRYNQMNERAREPATGVYYAT